MLLPFDCEIGETELTEGASAITVTTVSQTLDELDLKAESGNWNWPRLAIVENLRLESAIAPAPDRRFIAKVK